MAERGKARITLISAGSNTTVKSGAGTLYGLHSSQGSNALIRIDDAIDLGAAPDLNNPGSATMYLGVRDYLDFGPGVGFNDGLTVAASSNARLSVVWE